LRTSFDNQNESDTARKKSRNKIRRLLSRLRESSKYKARIKTNASRQFYKTEQLKGSICEIIPAYKKAAVSFGGLKRFA